MIFPIDPTVLDREPELHHSRAFLYHSLAHPSASEVALDANKRDVVGFASLREFAAFIGVLSFSPIVLSQYLLKPFLNLLLLFSGLSNACCLILSGLHFSSVQTCRPYSCISWVQFISLVSFNSTATL